MAGLGEPRGLTMHRLALEALSISRGGSILIGRALATCGPGERLEVSGADPALGVELAAWCRQVGHRLVRETDRWLVERGTAIDERWQGAQRSSPAHLDPRSGVAELAEPRWGLAARGALVDAATPGFEFALRRKVDLWSDEAPRLYRMAAAAQWDPETATDWSRRDPLPAEIERAVVQVMTYLVENETVALMVPARFLAQLHPHFREVMQLLAIQTADEARHIEVFTRRIHLHGSAPGTSSAGGQASLKSLLDEPDFSLAAFLLSVLGEGSFLSLLHFLGEHGPDAATRDICILAAQDEARHVAFGLAHLREHATRAPGLRARLTNALERRHGVLTNTAGLNADVFDALVVLAAGEFTPAGIARGFDRVMALQADMDAARRGHLERLGYSDREAEAMSALHTRNFM